MIEFSNHHRLSIARAVRADDIVRITRIGDVIVLCYRVSGKQTPVHVDMRTYRVRVPFVAEEAAFWESLGVAQRARLAVERCEVAPDRMETIQRLNREIEVGFDAFQARIEEKRLLRAMAAGRPAVA